MRNLLILFSLLFCANILSSQEIKLITYNIKYANENDGVNSWSHRKDWITDQIIFYEPDILGLQEAVKSQLEHFSDKINQYQIIGEAREGDDKGEFSAILFKKDKYQLLKSDTFWLSETPDKISKGWDAALNRICTYALFEDKESGKRFYIFNTHFDHIGKNARIGSAKLIVDKIKSLNNENLPVVLMGDFNLEPKQEGIQIILNALNDSRDMARNTFGPIGTFNGYNFAAPVTRRIDYIFVNEKVGVKKYAVLSDSKNLKYPSDHFPVFILAEL